MINTNKKDTMETKEQALYLTHINYKGKKIKLPFKILSTTARDETREVQATNRFSQQSITSCVVVICFCFHSPILSYYK